MLKVALEEKHDEPEIEWLGSQPIVSRPPELREVIFTFRYPIRDKRGVLYTQTITEAPA